MAASVSSTNASSVTLTPTTVNGTTRFSGLASGVDVDSLVQKLMEADQGTLNNLKKQQLDQWKQDQYRTIIADVNTFASKYLDLTSPNSILTQGNFLQFQVTSSSGAVLATAGTTAAPGNHTITVSQLATAGTQASASGITMDVTGSALPDYSLLSGTSFNITVDGTTRTVLFSSAFDPTTQTGVEYVQAAINNAIGTTTTAAAILSTK